MRRHSSGGEDGEDGVWMRGVLRRIGTRWASLVICSYIKQLEVTEKFSNALGAGEC